MNETLIRKRIERAIADKIFPGAVVGVINKEGGRKIVSAGSFTYESDSSRVTEETVYDMASVTKSIPVALMALMFIEQGRLSLDDQVIQYIPEIKIKDAEKGLIKHLLTYTYALKKNPNPSFSYEHAKVDDILDFHFNRDFDFLPGTKYRYGNAPANLVGIILERISGKKLYDLAGEMLLLPMNMKNSTFSPKNKSMIPPTEIVSWRGAIQGVVHDETAFILQNAGYNPGCAGLFSNAGDILNVLEMLLGRGVLKGSRLMEEQTFSLMTTNALGSIGQWHGMGWEINQPRFMGRYANEHMIGKTGFTGTYCVADVTNGTAMVLLSNRTYPKRGNADALYELRRDIADIVFTP